MHSLCSLVLKGIEDVVDVTEQERMNLDPEFGEISLPGFRQGAAKQNLNAIGAQLAALLINGDAFRSPCREPLRFSGTRTVSVKKYETVGHFKEWSDALATFRDGDLHGCSNAYDG